MTLNVEARYWWSRLLCRLFGHDWHDNTYTQVCVRLGCVGRTWKFRQ